MKMIVDAHCHAFASWRSARDRGGDGSISRYTGRAHEAGIGQTILFPGLASDYGVANRHVARIIKAFPERFLGFAFVHAERDRGKIRTLVGTAVQRYGFGGIKAHRYDAAITDEVCMAAREFGIPLIYDIVDDVGVLPSLAAEYPDIAIIIPHLGSFADNLSSQLGCIREVARHKNLYADTSAVKVFAVLERAIKEAGAHKIIFGSDAPWLHPGLELAKIRALGLEKEMEELIVGGNILRILSRGRKRLVLPIMSQRMYNCARRLAVVAGSGQ